MPGNRRSRRNNLPVRRETVHITGIISALIIGLVIGALGRLVVPGRQSIPIWLTMVIGIVAALLGTVIAGALHVADTNGVDCIELFIQVALAAGALRGAAARWSGGGARRVHATAPAESPGSACDSTSDSSTQRSYALGAALRWTACAASVTRIACQPLTFSRAS